MVEGKRPLFFKVFLPDLSSERLRIPVGFLKHMEGKTSGSVSLTGPSGNTWGIDLIQDSDGLFFQDGWPVFVRDHIVQIGDFFVFRYDGNLHFTVCIFDQSACEKEAAFYVKCSQDIKHKESKRGKKKAGKLLNASSYKPFKGVAKRMRGNSHLVHSGYITRSRAAKVQTCDKGFEQEDAFTTRRNQGSAFFNGKEKRGRPSKNSVSFSLPSLSKACKDEPGIEHKDDYFPRKHQESAFFNAKKKPGRLSKNSVSSSLPIPKACKDEPGIEHKDEYFTRKHQESAFFNGRNKSCKPFNFLIGERIGRKKAGKLLNASSYKTVKGVPKRMRGNSHLVHSGYITRSRSAKVQTFDKCFEQGDVFTRKHQESAFFNRKKKRGRPSKNSVCSSLLSLSKACKDEPGIEHKDEYFPRKHQESAFFNGKKKRGRPSKNSASSSLFTLSKACKDEPGFETGEILLTGKHRGVVFFNERTKFGRQSKSIVSSVISQSKACKDELGSHSKGYFSKTWSKTEEERAAQYFTSSFPYFVRFIHKSSVCNPNILTIPSCFSKAHLPKYKTKIVLHNSKGESWMVTSVPTPKTMKRYVFSAGWTAFVRDNKIKTADICIFELVGKLEMCVHIFQGGKQCSRISKSSVGFSHLSLSKAWEVNQDQHLQSPKSDELVKIKAGVVAPKDITTADVDMSIQGIGSRSRGCLARRQYTTEEERKKVRKAAESFTSKCPYFVTCMKIFNVSKSFILSIPKFFSVAHFSRYKKHTEIVLWNSRGEHWIVNLVHQGTQYTFSGGWASFIRGNKIEEGDTCAFVLVGEFEMHVHIFRLIDEV